MSLDHKTGYAALIGRPNAGKSTLLNTILQTKLVAVTPRPQTTRNRIFGIYDRDDAQIVFQDTPGLLEPKDSMHQFMMREAERALEDADVAVWLIDAIKGVTDREKIISQKVLASFSMPLIIAFNKVDKVPLSERAALQNSLAGFTFPESHRFEYISALYGDGVPQLVETLLDYMPLGPKLFPPDQLSDRTTRFFVEEIIREKAFLQLKEELPYSLAVRIETMQEGPNLTKIQATLHVERDSQKGIILGKSGSMIRSIGTEARLALEELLGTKVFLELWVKVSKGWRKKEGHLRDFGYQE
ncbi:MAG: GTPase Era [bacterium]|nr:GTPase Era [bacterium]